MTATAYYVYGVVPSGAAAPAPPVELLGSGRLAAVVERVRVQELEQDAEAVVARALTHQDVLDRLLTAGLPVVPFRFATLYAAADEIDGLLRDREQELLAAVSSVEGRVELGVKLRVDAGAVSAEDPRIARLERELATSGPGAAHLRRKQLERVRAAAVAAERRRRADALHDVLARFAVAARANPLPEDADDVVLNGAYLVERASEAAFRSLAGEAGAQLGRVEVTGPWPAYNFVDAELA